MSLKRKIKSKKQGVSPVIGIILMVLVTASLIGLVTVALSDPSGVLIADTDSNSIFRQPLTINGTVLIVVLYHILFIDTRCDCK